MTQAPAAVVPEQETCDMPFCRPGRARFHRAEENTFYNPPHCHKTSGPISAGEDLKGGSTEGLQEFFLSESLSDTRRQVIRPTSSSP